MSRIAVIMMLAGTFAVAMSGCCCLHRGSPKKICAPYVSARGDVPLNQSGLEGGVDYRFDSVPRFEQVRQNLYAQLTTGEPVKIDLLQVACLAARNSEVADMIEAERHAVKCQSDDRRSQTIDLILQGESIELRNKAAGAAAEMFLGLVQVQMQRDLVEESKRQLDSLTETVQAADEAGFATAEGKNEIAKGRNQLDLAVSQLDSVEQKLMYQLNRLINFESEKLVRLEPVHSLAPGRIDIDVRRQTAIAESSRPGVIAIESALAQGAASETIYMLLSQFDSRLGIRLPPVALKKKFIIKQLIDQFKLDEAPDGTAETRNQQIQQVLAGRRKEARIEAHDALLRLQTSLEKLAIVNENISRLTVREEQLRSKLEIDGADSYIEMNRNWIELQQAKSERVDAAIEHEQAKIKLLQAKGELAAQCGYRIEAQDPGLFVDQEVEQGMEVAQEAFGLLR